jgi:hypothetical protein
VDLLQPSLKKKKDNSEGFLTYELTLYFLPEGVLQFWTHYL